jgi:hypothetical protein
MSWAKALEQLVWAVAVISLAYGAILFLTLKGRCTARLARLNKLIDEAEQLFAETAREREAERNIVAGMREDLEASDRNLADAWDAGFDCEPGEYFDEDAVDDKQGWTFGRSKHLNPYRGPRE